MAAMEFLDDEMLAKAEELVALCAKKGIKVSTAESCTGGMISACITAIPGSSAVTDGSLVSYANEVKARLLRVDEETINTKGVVSSECVEQMTLGAAGMFGSDLTIAVSGIAGPGGGTPEKPVGTVYICVRYGSRCKVERCLFDGDRHSVRRQTTVKALTYAIQMIS